MKSTGRIRNPKVEVKTSDLITDPIKVNSDVNSVLYDTTPISYKIIRPCNVSTLEIGVLTGTPSLYQSKVRFTKEYKEALAFEFKKETDIIISKLDAFIEMRINQVTEKLTEKIAFLQMEVDSLKGQNLKNADPGFIEKAWTGTLTGTVPSGVTTILDDPCDPIISTCGPSEYFYTCNTNSK